MLIVDAQSVKNTETAHIRGYDAGKKIKGIKRHIAVDTQGLPHLVTVTPASTTDRAGAVEMIQGKISNFPRLIKLLVDAGYQGAPFAEEAYYHLGACVEVVKRSDINKHTFQLIPKRWIVERTFSWLEKCRRLWKNGERLITSSVGMVQLALIRVMLKRL